MFENLQQQKPDAILTLVQMFRDDRRCDKIDLGVGVYKDSSGNTPVMRSVKAAEQKLWELETTKSYVALTGDPCFFRFNGESGPRGCSASRFSFRCSHTGWYWRSPTGF